jgi:hypothetical protein
MTNADKFLVAVQTGLLSAQNFAPFFTSQAMLKAVELSECVEITNSSLATKVEEFLKYVVYSTQYEWIVSKVGKPVK